MSVDWPAVFSVKIPLLELFARGTAMYLVLFAALRILVRRHIGSLSLMDLLLMVLIAMPRRTPWPPTTNRSPRAPSFAGC